MSIGKSVFITTLFMGAIGGMIYCFWEFSIRSYYVAVQMIALYGFIMLGINMVRWLAKAPVVKDPYWDGESRD